MKKNVLLLVLSISMLLLIGGCSKKDNTDDNTENAPTVTEGAENTDETDTADITDGTDTPAAEPLVNTLSKGDYKLEDHITLGQYKGVEVTVEKLEVTEEDLNTAIQNDMIANGAAPTEITDRPVQNGDTVNIDFEGFKDDVAFEGGTAAGVDLTIGSGQFIPGFEEKLIGTNVGDKVDLDLTFPEDYQSEDLAGQDVVFKVTVNSIKQYELNEDYVLNNTEYESIEAYTDAIREELVLVNEETMKVTKENNVYSKVLENAEIISIPQSLIDYYVNDIKVIYTNTAQMYGMDLASFITANGMTEEVFNSTSQEYAESIATRELILNAIIKAENIEITEEEFNTKVDEYVAEYGYESSEQFLEEADEDILREDILFRKVLEFLSAEAVEI
ncbi:trigger factor [Mobilitalea sibirica]|uniref:peptidylprolyl isomerase n=1 Tax=Mobilitalea sibirica TaxID=1462919 RepID=A0A8J7H4U9_9FIRM|nr:trigger factor [Mobilitalea sibirica]MBH1942077.1 trigger factor [Mobilitalea sibirica]